MLMSVVYCSNRPWLQTVSQRMALGELGVLLLPIPGLLWI